MDEPIFVRTDEVTDFVSFLKSVDWTEAWLMGLLLFHIMLTLFTLLTRNYYVLQAVLFFCLLLAVRFSESINEYGAKHWQRFSNQQYFDSQGLFISVVFSMPVLFNCLMMVIHWLWQSSNLMARVRRVELETKGKAQNATELQENTEREKRD